MMMEGISGRKKKIEWGHMRQKKRIGGLRERKRIEGRRETNKEIEGMWEGKKII